MHTRSEMIVQSCLEMKLFFLSYSLAPMELSIKKSRNDQEGEEYMSEHLLCQTVVFPPCFVFYISLKFRPWTSKRCHYELNLCDCPQKVHYWNNLLILRTISIAIILKTHFEHNSWLEPYVENPTTILST